jgi:hypothetical protein
MANIVVSELDSSCVLSILWGMQFAKDGVKKIWISVATLLVSALFAPTQAQTSTQPRTVLRGQLPAAVPNLQPLGRVDATKVLQLSISLPLRNTEGLASLLEQIYNPASPAYRHYLTPDEFDAQFGPTKEDYQSVVDWAKHSGFTIGDNQVNRMLLEVSAPVSAVESALHVAMRNYAHPTEHRTFFAPDTDPSLDANLPISNIEGLDNFARPHPKNLHRVPLNKSAKLTPKNIGTGPNGILAGTDYRAAYAPGVTLTGTGQSVGLLEFDGYYPGDITSYESQTGVPSVTLQRVLVGGFNGTPTPPGEDSGNSEVALDIEMAISMAPGLSSVVVFEASPTTGNPLTLLNTMSSSTYASVKQFSCSWDFGSINRTSMDTYFMKFGTQGQSFFDAVGDYGAYNSANPSTLPDDDPYVTLVGGTTLGTAGPGEPWLSETVWNIQGGPFSYSSSGGVSTYYNIATMAKWQEGVSMTLNNGSTTKRNMPDVAMVADNIFIVADDGTNENTGGTSCSSPLWAGFTALVNQQAVAAGLPTVGFLNPALYNIGTNSGYLASFDDVILGNNTNNVANEYVAAPGFDLCTGWGSPTGSSMIIALTQPDGFQITPGRGAVANGPVGGPFTVSSQVISLANTGNAAFNWSLSEAPTWLNVSSTGGTLAGAGSDSVSLSLNSAADGLAAGVYTANLWFTNQTSGLAQLRQFTLQVDQNLVLDGGFEAGDLCYWTLSGDTNIWDNNFVDTGYYSGLTPYDGNYFAALGNYTSLAFLSQTLPTKPGQYYLLSFWLENLNGAGDDIPNQFQVQWNSNSTSSKIIYNQVDMGIFAWSNMQFMVQASSDAMTLSFGATNYAYFGLDDVSVTPIAVPVPSFEAPTIVSGAIQLSWNSVSGVSYQMQYTSTLSPADWVNIGSSITATASSTTVFETLGTGSGGFYRVMISP